MGAAGPELVCIHEPVWSEPDTPDRTERTGKLGRGRSAWGAGATEPKLAFSMRRLLPRSGERGALALGYPARTCRCGVSLAVRHLADRPRAGPPSAGQLWTVGARPCQPANASSSSQTSPARAEEYHDQPMMIATDAINWHDTGAELVTRFEESC
jgi:hypothetical protein